MNTKTSPHGRHRCIRLYNLLFPVWLFYLIPSGLWLLILPANFAVDSLVLRLAMKRLDIPRGHEIWKLSILRIWLIGFLCDLLGAALTLGIQLLMDVVLDLGWNTFLFPGATLLAVPGVLFSAFLIYILDKKYAFVKCPLEEDHTRKLSLALSLFTAPYAMLIPLYG